MVIELNQISFLLVWLDKVDSGKEDSNEVDSDEVEDEVDSGEVEDEVGFGEIIFSKFFFILLLFLFSKW